MTTSDEQPAGTVSAPFSQGDPVLVPGVVERVDDDGVVQVAMPGFKDGQPGFLTYFNGSDLRPGSADDQRAADAPVIRSEVERVWRDENDRLRAELAETRRQLAIVYDAEWSRSDALAQRLRKLESAGDARPAVARTDGQPPADDVRPGHPASGLGPTGMTDPICGDEHDTGDQTWTCTRYPEHRGQHVAAGLSVVEAVWPAAPADGTAAPGGLTTGVRVEQGDGGTWGWECTRCDYRSVPWWSDRDVAERAAAEHERDRCPAAGQHVRDSQDGGAS